MAAPKVFFVGGAYACQDWPRGGATICRDLSKVDRLTGRAQHVAWLVSRDVAELAGSDKGLHHFGYSRDVTQTLCSRESCSVLFLSLGKSSLMNVDTCPQDPTFPELPTSYIPLS